jgi:hypothetical protein
MRRQVWVAAALALLLAPATASAESAEIERRCTAMYPNISQYFARKDCVKTATEREAEENLKLQREEAARPCLAADIPRMEGLAAKAREAVKSELTLEEAQAALKLIIGRQGTISIPKDSIKDRVLVTSIDTICDAPFDFLINVRKVRIRNCAGSALGPKTLPPVIQQIFTKSSALILRRSANKNVSVPKLQNVTKI